MLVKMNGFNVECVSLFFEWVYDDVDFFGIGWVLVMMLSDEINVMVMGELKYFFGRVNIFCLCFNECWESVWINIGDYYLGCLLFNDLVIYV